MFSELHLDDKYLVKARNKRAAREEAFERIENETGTPRRDIEIYSVRKVKSLRSTVRIYLRELMKRAMGATFKRTSAQK